MKTVTIDKLSNYEGKDVELKGWVYNTRNVGKIWFVIFRDCLLYTSDAADE